MTNHWTDIANSSLVFAIGCNPSENHPACMAHINKARFDLWTDADGNATPRHRKATFIVVDPRKTRTAIQADYHVRIRPGTDIAFINGVLNYLFANAASLQGTNSPISNTLINGGAGASTLGSIGANMLGWHNGTAANSTSTGRTFIDDGGNHTRGLIQSELDGAKYDGAATTAFFDGASSHRAWPKYTDSRIKVNGAGTDYQRATLTTTSGWTFSNMPVFADSVSDPDSVYQKLIAQVAPYDLATVADICGCSQGEIINVSIELLAHSRFNSSDFGLGTANVLSSGYKSTTLLYAMGATQHSKGSQNIRDYAILQSLMGNMGRAGGGINALRGIHNVQGSTDMGLLFDSIPAYSNNPSVNQTFSDYQNHLFGNRVAGVTTKSPYVIADLGLQQRGFLNMTKAWFGDASVTAPADIDSLYGLWPKGNGVDHVTAFRQMESGTIKAALVWGQNPAVSEPNQSHVRAGLKNLDLLVCVDIFETETGACDRKSTGITYLLPSCSHVEEAGSITNSGRWLQWRERATKPAGNSKADIELLIKVAKGLNAAGAFAHISSVWSGIPSLAGKDPFTVLYAKHGFDASVSMDDASITGVDDDGVTLAGSELVCNSIFKEMAQPLDAAGVGGTMWIYSGNGNAAGYYSGKGDVQPPVGAAWTKSCRAKNRDATNYSDHASYPRWGFAWLLNRRVFYNNGELGTKEVADTFVAPALLSRLYAITTNTVADWSAVYRYYSTLKDQPSVSGPQHVFPIGFPCHTEPYESPRPDLVTKWGKNTASGVSLIKGDTAVGAFGDPKVDSSKFDLILTTIRCVEHFQGGPITRNNPWNVELEPEPWIEINSVDARKNGIVSGDWVNIKTARSNSTSDQVGRTNYTHDAANPTDNFGKGFRARVGVGLQSNQRVPAGMVAIPWHWGDRGLSTGSRANDLCIDVGDANTVIPEYKACLCKIVKA